MSSSFKLVEDICGVPAVQLRYYHDPIGTWLHWTKDRRDWHTMPSVLSNIAYVAFPLLLRCHGGAHADHVLAYAVTWLAVGSAWYHLDRLGLRLVDRDPNDADYTWGHMVDNQAMDFLFVLIIVIGLTDDPSYGILIGPGLGTVAVHSGVGACLKRGGGAAVAGAVLVDIALMIGMWWSVVKGVQDDRIDEAWAISAGTMYALAMVLWVFRQHAVWHLVTALAIAFFWRGIRQH
jgi:hypothetical protein